MDDSAPGRSDAAVDAPWQGVWLGVVVPKRHARRAVTRTMIKRQIKGAMTALSAPLERGLWVVRLRAPIDRAAFPSATSPALVRVIHDQLQAVFSHAARPRSAR